MNRRKRGLKYARDAAKMSTMRCRVGAAIFVGNHLLSIGWNSHKTSPKNESILRWHHAETAALVGTDRAKLSKAAIYVARIAMDDTLKMAKPCRDCRNALRAAGIRFAFYTNRDGKLSRLDLRQIDG